MRASTRASSIAVSPPPTTTTGLPLYKKPSQVAQEETPPPLRSSSPDTPDEGSHQRCNQGGHQTQSPKGRYIST